MMQLAKKEVKTSTKNQHFRHVSYNPQMRGSNADLGMRSLKVNPSSVERKPADAAVKSRLFAKDSALPSQVVKRLSSKEKDEKRISSHMRESTE